MNLFYRVLKDICTNKNDKDYCHSKTIGLLAFLALMGFTGYSFYRDDKYKFDPFAWSTGAASIIVAAAGGAKIKETTEPDQ